MCHWNLAIFRLSSEGCGGRRAKLAATAIHRHHHTIYFPSNSTRKTAMPRKQVPEVGPPVISGDGVSRLVSRSIAHLNLAYLYIFPSRIAHQ